MADKKRELTDLEKEFLRLVSLEDFDGNLEKAKVAAGYSKGTNAYQVAVKLGDQIREIGEAKFLSRTNKAIKVIDRVLDEPKPMGSDSRLKAAEMVFDYAKFSKKNEEVEIDGSISAILILPSKD